MKAKVSRGGGFRGALNYVFDVGPHATHTKNSERVGGNMAGQAPRELAAEFSAVRQLRPDISRPVWHCSLSLPPGERLSAEEWDAVASDFLQHMGFDQAATPWVAVRHQDTDKDHIHILLSRVALDGKVWHGKWEARRAIEATQELERIHGLVLTPGLGDERAELKAMSAAEINRAVRTGEEPPRQRLQLLVEAAISDKPSALQLAERLEAAGVSVRANLASTGRMSGFSFEIGGVAFKGSDLGARYKWAGLQKAGVTYVEARDREGLERFRTPVADRGEREGFAADRDVSAGGVETAAGSYLSRDSEGVGTPGSTSPGGDFGTGRLRSSDDLSEENTPRFDPADERERDTGIRATSGKNGGKDRGIEDQPVSAESESQRHGADYKAGGDSARQADDRAAEHERGSQPTDRGRETDAPAPLEAGPGIDFGRRSGRDGGSDWASRFRQASAAKRRDAGAGILPGGVGEGDTRGAGIDPADRQSAREINPTAYLENSGFTVKPVGHHLSVRLGTDEIYRITQQQDGHWLWCDRAGKEGGDNIDLVREIQPGMGFIEAVYQLLAENPWPPARPVLSGSGQLVVQPNQPSNFSDNGKAVDDTKSEVAGIDAEKESSRKISRKNRWDDRDDDPGLGG